MIGVGRVSKIDLKCEKNHCLESGYHFLPWKIGRRPLVGLRGKALLSACAAAGAGAKVHFPGFSCKKKLVRILQLSNTFGSHRFAAFSNDSSLHLCNLNLSRREKAAAVEEDNNIPPNRGLRSKT